MGTRWGLLLFISCFRICRPCEIAEAGNDRPFSFSKGGAGVNFSQVASYGLFFLLSPLHKRFFFFFLVLCVRS